MYRLTIRIRSDDTIRPNTNTLFGPLFGTEANAKQILYILVAILPIISKDHLFFVPAGAALPLAAAAANPAAPGPPPPSAADKYSAIADLESVFSTTSIGGGSFGFQGAGVNWPGGACVDNV